MFFTSNARNAFTKLTQVFVKAPILNYFDLEYHIQMKMYVSGYTIGKILSKLILDNLGQWHSVVFLFQKMISTKTRFEIYNDKLLY